MEDNKEWRFAVAANIVHSHLGEDGKVYYGTKAFTPGTKVYLNGKEWNNKSCDISVIGLDRFHHFVFEIVPISLLENIRTKRIYNPVVLRIMNKLEYMDGFEFWSNTHEDEKDTIRFVNEWINMRNKS